MSDRISTLRYGVAILAMTCATLLPALLAGCSEEPTQQNSVSSSIPLADLVTRDTTIAAVGSTSFKQHFPMNGSYNLVGNSTNATATMALMFYPSTFPPRDTVRVYGATLTLSGRGFYGDTLGSFGFTVYRITRSWTETSATWDSLQLGFYETSPPRGSYSLVGGPADQKVVVDLDTAMVRAWLATNVSGQTTKFGIALVPTVGTTCIRSFYAFNADTITRNPTLQIIAGSPTGLQRDTTVFTQGIDTFGGNIDNLNTDPSLLYLQAGVGYRSSLKFEVGFIPRGAIINRAELLLTRNDAASRVNRFGLDTALTAHVRTALDSSLEGAGTTAYHKAAVAHGFGFDLRHAVQTWIRGANYGVILRVTSPEEYQTLDLSVFYGPSALNAADRPRLAITYSVAKQ